jgi:steroid delta-isomerase-like uncharacterized protein
MSPRSEIARDEIEELVDRWQSAWAGRKPDAFAELATPGLHYEDPLTPEPLEGPIALGRHARRLWDGVPDARVEKTGERLTDGRFVAAPVRLLGTHRAQLGPVPATGKFVVLNAVIYGEVQHGRFTRVRTFFDLWSVAVQLGMLPEDGSLGQRALFLLRGFGLRPAS